MSEEYEYFAEDDFFEESEESKNSFKGNPNLKPIGFQHNFNPFQTQEYIRCARDPVYFIVNYVKIISLDHGMIPFKLYPIQEEYIRCLHDNRMVISMQGRQSGKTTTTAAYLVWYSLFNEDVTVAILANKSSAAREILSRYQLMYENLPLWMQQGVKAYNKGNVELENGSKVFTAATSASGIRGKSVNFLYIDEVAIIPNNVADEFFTATYPVISSGKKTKIALTSTPLGMNHFHKFWKEAEAGINGFIPFQVHYYDIPGRDEQWLEDQLKLLGEVKFNQEVMCEFLGSSHTLISGSHLSRLAMQRPLKQTESMCVYEEPIRTIRDSAGKVKQEGHVYFMTVDVSRGLDNDYSAITVIDITTTPYNMVAKYRNNKIAPISLPEVIYRVGREYNNAYVLIEINDLGQQVADILHNDLEYENIVQVIRHPTQGQYISAFGRGNIMFGVRTDKKVKKVGCANLKTMIEGNQLIVRDHDTITEFSTFIKIRESYAADIGFHDDLVMCLVLFAWASTNTFFKDLTDPHLREKLIEAQAAMIEEDMLPLGFYGEDREETFVADGMVWETGDMRDYGSFQIF